MKYPIEITEYVDEYFSELLNYCKQESNIGDNASSNMWSEDWETSPETILYILKNNIRFDGDNGKFYLLRCNGVIIGCSGVYISEFSKDVAIAGSRTWITSAFRNMQLVKDYLLPAQRDWAIARGISVIACTFNYYNRNLQKLFIKGQKLGMRTPRHLFYKNFNMLEFPVLIQYVPQWVIFENINDYRYDWTVIKSGEDFR